MPYDTPILTCENEKEMSDQLTNFVVMCYKDALEDRGRFAIALTGGQAVTLLARRITEEPFVSYIDWTKWYVFFVDERCTSLDNPCSSYYMVDKALLQHVKIPEMQVFPAYDPMLPLDKRGHACEAAALAYEQRMRSVLGEEDGFPLLDVVLVGADSAGNVASLFENHPISENRIRNYEITWGAEGKFRVLGPQQAACALYECPLDLFDVVLSEEERAQCRRRGIPKERVALTVKAINHAQHVLVCITDLESGPLLKEYFEGAKQGELPIFDRAGLNLLQGRSGRPKLFAHRKAIDGFITLPQLLRTFQVQDLAFSITEARGAAAAAAQTSESDSDSEGEEYTRRLEMEEQELASALKKGRNASRQASLRGSKEGSPLAISPLRRQPAGKRLLPTKEATREEGGTFSRANSLTRVGSITRAGSLRRMPSIASEKGGKGMRASGDAEAMRVHGEDTSGDEEEQESMSAVAAKEGQVIVPDDFSNLPDAVAHIEREMTASATKRLQRHRALQGGGSMREEEEEEEEGEEVEAPRCIVVRAGTYAWSDALHIHYNLEISGAGPAEYQMEGQGRVENKSTNKGRGGTLLAGAILVSCAGGALRKVTMCCPEASVEEAVLAFESYSESGGEGGGGEGSGKEGAASRGTRRWGGVAGSGMRVTSGGGGAQQSCKLDASAWNLDSCHVIVAPGRKGITVAGNSKLEMRRCSVRGCGHADGEDARTGGLARCGIQGYDSAVIEVKESTLGGSRQGVALFDQASISIQDSRVQLPPDSFVVAQNDETQAKLHRVHVALDATADTPQGGGGGGVGGSGKDAAVATGLATMRCGVFWGSNGNRASLSIKSCSFDGSLAGRQERDDILWGGQTSKVKELLVDEQTATADRTKWCISSDVPHEFGVSR